VPQVPATGSRARGAPGSHKFWPALALLLALGFASGSAPAKEKTTEAKDGPVPIEIPEKLTPEQADAILAKLTDAQARQLLARQLHQAAARHAAAEPKDSGGMGMLLVKVRKGLEGSGDDTGRRAALVAEGLALVPSALASSIDKVSGGKGAAGLAIQFAVLIALLAAGYAAHWTARHYVVARHVRSDPPPNAPFGTRLAAALLRLALELIPLAAFSLVTVWLAHLFFAPGSAERTFHITYLTGAILVWAAALLLRLVLAPQSAALRLLRLSDETAFFLHQWLLRVIAVSIFLWLTAGLLILTGVPLKAHLVMVLITGTVVGVMVLVMILQCRTAVAAAIREGAGGAAWRANLAATWHLFALVAILYVLVIWLLWATSMLDQKASAIWAAVASVGVLLVYPLLDRWIGRGIDDMLASGAPETEAKRHEVALVLHRVMRVLLVVLLFAGIHELWDFDVFDEAGAKVRHVLVAASFDHAAAILLAVVGWQLDKIGIDRRLAPREVNGVLVEPTQRARTLLPLARKFIIVVLVVMTVMLVLSALGVNIGPLLAGAGVVGLAVGFGAQTLVRDIITGVFFLLDDAFRVGEYVASGNYKGTVEAIGIRAVKLRHHRGPVYTVPFSELRAIQNQSRDWVIDKFNIGITYDSDLEKARKLIKKIGEQLAADPQHAPQIIEPLKMQGVEQFGDFAIQVRVKMMTKPGEQFVIRRKANAMIKKAFDENGIKFAFPTVQVTGGAEAAAGSDAVAAAARQAAAVSQQPSGG
jgi:small-conductance mechanosensitive channel